MNICLLGRGGRLYSLRHPGRYLTIGSVSFHSIPLDDSKLAHSPKKGENGVKKVILPINKLFFLLFEILFLFAVISGRTFLFAVTCYHKSKRPRGRA